jgi:hypothetical protein
VDPRRRHGRDRNREPPLRVAVTFATLLQTFSMRQRRYISRKWVLLIPAVLALVFLLPMGWRAARRLVAYEYRTYHSPDRRFQIVLYNFPTFFGTMPGQGSDASGYFQLRDSQTGRVLEDQDVDMVQMVELVEWSPNQVRIGILADWTLPR